MSSTTAAAPPVGWRQLVSRAEWPALLACAGAYFSLLCGYYMLRSLREAFALQVGREQIDQLFYLTFVVMMAVLPAYWWIVARVRRRTLFLTIYATVIMLFVLLGIGLAWRADSRALAAIYFVAVTALNLFMVSVFWSVMVDLWRSGAAKRVFGFVAAGGSLGALSGPAFNAFFVGSLGPSVVIFIACGMLGLTIVLGSLAQTRLAAGAGGGAQLNVAVGGRAIEDLKRLARSPYLLAIAAMIVAGQVLGAFMYNEQARYVEANYLTLTDRAALFARIDFWVNVLSVVLQTAVVGWLAARGGLRLALSAVPLVLIASLVVLALLPVGLVLLVTQVVRRAADYGLFKPTREMLFTVLNSESKFKSKSLIDTLLQRGGDSLGQLSYGFAASLGLAGIAWLCAALSAVMLLVAVWVGGRFAQVENAGEANGRAT